jgi:hypothetical protein
MGSRTQEASQARKDLEVLGYEFTSFLSLHPTLSHSGSHLSVTADLKHSTVRCLVFGDAAHALSQLRAGSVVAIFRCRFGDPSDHGNSIKVLDADQVQYIGTSADMGYCAGTTKAGARCSAVVNKALHQQYCDLHLAQAKQAIAMRARPECKGTLLVTGLDPPTQRRGDGGKGRCPSWQKKLAAGNSGVQRSSTRVPLLLFGSFGSP